MTTPVGGTSAASASAATKAASPASTAFDKDTFMKLLVAQLKYQNPSSPTDSNAYMSQMAVFAQVEKLGQLLTSQQASQAWQQRVSAEGLVGRQVTGLGSDETLHTGVVTGVTLGHGAPTLTLSDGTALGIDHVTKVEQAPST